MSERNTVNVEAFLDHIYPLFGRGREKDGMADRAMLALAHVFEGVDPTGTDMRTQDTRVWLYLLRKSELICGAEGAVPDTTFLGEILVAAFQRGRSCAVPCSGRTPCGRRDCDDCCPTKGGGDDVPLLQQFRMQ